MTQRKTSGARSAMPLAALLFLAACKATRPAPPDYTRGLYEPFAFDNVIPYAPRDNDEAFYPPEYTWSE